MRKRGAKIATTRIDDFPVTTIAIEGNPKMPTMKYTNTQKKIQM
jgi:hypothetical protein